MIDWRVLAVMMAMAWMGFQLITMVVVTVQLLRLSFGPLRVRRGLDGKAPTPQLASDHTALLEELRRMGFELQWLGTQEFGEVIFPAAVLRHKSEPAYAGVSFQPSVLSGYPVTFYSFDGRGKLMTTANRVGWMSWLFEPGTLRPDPYAANLADHWQAHHACLSGASDMDVAPALERIWHATEGLFDRLRRADIIAQGQGRWHLRLMPAWRSAWGWWRVRRQLAKPYASSVTSGASQAEFLAHCYTEIEAQQASRPARHDVKATVLVLSMAVTLLLWGLAYDWRQAAALMVILFIHECGHALAMHLFGWKDMSMFFVPFVGAMVTGRAREMAAWKQVVVLLAGPLPGLIAGIVGFCWLNAQAQPMAHTLDWQRVAIMAMVVNLFNLLPMTPLDGGRLVEVALFSRWPRLRLVFTVASVLAFGLLALWVHSAWVMVIAVFLSAGLMSQWRAAQLHMAWRDGATPQEQLLNLFAAARKLSDTQALMRQVGMVKSVVAQRLVRVPRLWESVLTLSILGAVWGVSGLVSLQMWQVVQKRHEQQPSAMSASMKKAVATKPALKV